MPDTPQVPDASPPLPSRKGGRGRVLLVSFCAVVGGLLVLAFATKALRIVRVSTPAMEPALAPEDFVIIGYKRGLVTEDREKLVVFEMPDSRQAGAQTIMRVAGLPRDMISSDGTHLLINGRRRTLLPFPTDPRRPLDLSHPRMVPEGHFLALGDNAENSWDSRYFGFVPFSSVRGFSFSQPVRQEPKKKR